MNISKKGKLLILAFAFLGTSSLYSQPGCPNINAGLDQTLNCVTTCATLNASVLQTGESTSYSVSSVPYAPPYPYNGGTQIMANIDDTWSTAISLPFNFCFFGNVYNQIVVGSNGLITFDATVAGAYCSWSYSVTCPSTSLPKNAIFGPYHDIDPSISGGLYYGIQGVAPCRTFVISFYDVAMFSSSCNSLKATHQIVLYENTNVIEVYMQNKPTCSSWNSGNALVGIQNSTGTVGFTAPARNTSQWTTSNEAWRFTPNGLPNYSVAWFEGATQIGTGLSISVCPTSTTTYTGKVTYTNCDAAQVVIQDQVTVNRINDLSLSVTPTTPSFCAGNNTNITATGATTYSWYPSTGLSTTSGGTVNANPTTTTTYNVIGTYGGCIDTVSTTITVTPGPVVTISNPTPLICSGSATLTASGATTYDWSPSATLSSPSGSSVNATPVGTQTYTVTGTTSGCSGTATATVTVNSTPTISISSNAPICENTSLNLTSSGGISYSWSGPNGYTSSDQNPIIPTASTSYDGTYTVTVTATGGCTATAQTTATVYPIPTPTASNTGAICAGANLTLNATGGTGYSWSGPNSYTNATQNPTIPTASTAYDGIYTVTVTATGGCTATAQTTAVVNPMPTPTASNTGAICAGANLTLNATGGTGYSWSGPNSYTNATQNPTIPTASTAYDGTYTVTVTATGGCTATAQTTAVVNPNPVVTTGSNTPICENTLLSLTSSGGTGYSWSGPNGYTSSDQNPSNSSTPTSYNGTYTVTVTGIGGCTSTAQTSVVVNAKPIVSVSPLAIQICQGADTTLTASGATSYFWTPTTGLNPTTGASTTASPSTTTTYTVHGSTNGCSDSTTVTVTIINNPAIQVSPIAISICPGEQTTLVASGGIDYTWSPSTSLNSSTGSNVTASPTSTTTYTVTGTTTGCSGIATATVTIKPLPQLTYTPVNPTICFNSSTSLTASGADSYSWSPDSTLSTNSGATVTAAPHSSCLYHLTGTLNGCRDSITIPFTVNALPTIQIHATPTIGCQPFGTVLSATCTPTAQTYSWNAGNGFTSSEPSPAVLYLNAGQYSVSVSITDINGCINSAIEPNFITVNPKPEVSFSISPDIGYVSQDVTFTSSYTNTNSHWSWTFGDGLNATVETPSTVHNYGTTGELSVTHVVVNEFGCSDTASLPYNVIVKIVIPNVFTPNHDGINDMFVIDGLQYVEGAKMKIYNRWGRKVYDNDNYKSNWDGGDYADGIYFYVLTLPDFLKSGPYNGSVTLLR